MPRNSRFRVHYFPDSQYLVKAIKSVLVELERNPEWSIRDALEHRRILFEHVVRFFKKTAGDQISTKAILQPQLCMEPQQEPFAWPGFAQPAADSIKSNANSAPLRTEVAPSEGGTQVDDS